MAPCLNLVYKTFVDRIFASPGIWGAAFGAGLVVSGGLFTPGSAAVTMGGALDPQRPSRPGSSGAATVPFSLPAESSAPLVYPLNDYRLTVGDMVYVIVTNVPDYSGTFQVMPDGALNLPVLGRVEAWGKTLTELETAITQGYAQGQI